jgi:hypothetical protein
MVDDMVGVNYAWILIGKVTLHMFCWHGKMNSEFVRLVLRQFQFARKCLSSNKNQMLLQMSRVTMLRLNILWMK